MLLGFFATGNKNYSGENFFKKHMVVDCCIFISFILKMSYEYFDSLTGDVKSRYLKKIELANLKECPYRLPAGIWKDDTSLWPNVHYGDIYEYLINTPGKNIFNFLVNKKYILIIYICYNSSCLIF